MGQIRGLVAVTALAAATLLGALTGCAGAPADDVEPSTAATDPATAPPPDPETPAAPTFSLPATCAEMVGDARVAEFDAAGLDLLGGPGGRYGSEYFADPTPEERAGGLTCVWGDEDDVASTIIVSVAPVSAATRDGVIADLLAQRLNEATIGGAEAFGVAGDDVSSPAILNVVREDSWISVIRARGGEESLAAATDLVEAVAAEVYAGG